MTWLTSALPVLAISAVCLAAAVGLLAWGWQKDAPRGWLIGRRLALAAAGLALAGLIWRGVQAAEPAVPAPGLGWGALAVALWLWLEARHPAPKPVSVVGVGLLLAAFGGGLAGLAGLPAGAEALSAGRAGLQWLVSAGLAAIFWPAIAVLFEWAAPGTTEDTLPADTLHRLAAFALLPGIAGLVALDGWQGAATGRIGPWAALWLALTALWWVRRALPERAGLVQAMTIASFGGVLLATIFLF